MKKKSIIIALFFIAFLLILNINSYGSQKWESLDYNVTLNTDGSMDVVETWNIYISETNTLFKDFELDSSKYGDITNVKVALIKNDMEMPLKQIYQEQYHVDSGCFYALEIGNGKFEIAWNVGLDNSSDTRTYKIYYTVKDAVKVYNDCTEFYWQFLGKDNNISGNNITGTIHLPNQVSDIEKLRVWAHGDLSGEIEKTNKNTVSFVLDRLSKNTMLEIRIVTEENIFKYASTVNGDKLNSILSEEQRWADEANAKRLIAKNVFLGLVLINVLILFLYIRKVKKINKEAKEIMEKQSYSDVELEYFREIPNEENATPARAAYLYYFTNNKCNLDTHISKIFAGTILDLSLKGLVSFEPTKDKNDVKIFVKDTEMKKRLSPDERVVYNLLSDAQRYNESVTTKELNKYSKVHYEDVYRRFNILQRETKEYEIECENINREILELFKKWQSKCMISFIIGFIFICFWIIDVFLPAVPLGFVLVTYNYWKNSKKFKVLTEKGNLEKVRWQGLYQYMNDYSLLKEKEVPDIVLWEKFLVYATTFGISKKVIKQLKVEHPEMFEPSSDLYRNYAYWHIVTSSNNGIQCFDSLNKGIERAYSSAISAYSAAHSSSSSGSGGGGGFSGGGGGRRRRWRLRRSLIILRMIFKRNKLGEKNEFKREKIL